MKAVKKPQLPPFSPLFSSILAFRHVRVMLHARDILKLLVSCKIAIDIATKQKSEDFIRSSCLDDAAMAYDFMAVLLRTWRYSTYPSFFCLSFTYWSVSFYDYILRACVSKSAIFMYGDFLVESEFETVYTKLQRELESMMIVSV